MNSAFLVQIHKAHIPDLHKSQHMVCQLWEDGEITLTKAMDLWGQRTLHTIYPKTESAVNFRYMPVTIGEHGYAFIESVDKALEIRALL